MAFLRRQGKIEGFLNNAANVDKIGGIVEDIRDAIMEYQVHIISFIPTTSNIYDRLRCNKISTTRVANSL